MQCIKTGAEIYHNGLGCRGDVFDLGSYYLARINNQSITYEGKSKVRHLDIDYYEQWYDNTREGMSTLIVKKEHARFYGTEGVTV